MAKKELDDWILTLGAEMQRLSTETAHAAPKLARQREWAPRVDVLETAEHILVKVELAGIRSGQFVIQYSAERQSVTVRGERRDEAVDPCVPTAPHQLEIDYGPFAREVRLPDALIDVARAQAQLSNGLLTIVLPKDGQEPSPEYLVERTITVRRIR